MHLSGALISAVHVPKSVGHFELLDLSADSLLTLCMMTGRWVLLVYRLMEYG